MRHPNPTPRAARSLAAALAAALAACGDATTAVPSVATGADARASAQALATDAAEAVLTDLDAFDAGESLSAALLERAPDGPQLALASAEAAEASADCTGPDAQGWFTCAGTRENGLTVTRRWRYWAGASVAPRYSALRTDSVNHRFTLAGTRALDDGPAGATRTLRASRERAATLALVRDAAGALTERRWDGVGARADTVLAATSAGTTTYAHAAADTVRGLRYGVPRTQFRWPLAGTVTHAVRTVATAPGGATRTSTHRVVVTFDGSATAQVLVGELRCTLDLATRRVTACQ